MKIHRTRYRFARSTHSEVRNTP